jgi:uncharacterized protein
MEKQPPLINIHHPFLQFLIFLLIVITSTFVFIALGGVLLQPLFHIKDTVELTSAASDPDSMRGNPTLLAAFKFLQVISSIGIFLFPPLLFGFLMGPKNDYLQLKRTSYLFPVLLSAIIILVSAPLVDFTDSLNQHLHLPAALKGIQNWMQSSEDENDKITQVFMQMPAFKDLLINLVVIAIIPAIGEELFFRGVIQQILIKWSRNKHAGVWVTAAIFSAFHLQFFGFIPRLILGALMGYIFLWSGNLWYSIIGHLFNNGVQVVLAYLFQAKIISYNIENNEPLPGWTIIPGTILLIGTLLLYYKYFKHHPPEEEDVVETEI